jgi:hypothetical protein
LKPDLGKDYAPADATEAIKGLYEDRRTHVLGVKPWERSHGAAEVCDWKHQPGRDIHDPELGWAKTYITDVPQGSYLRGQSKRQGEDHLGYTVTGNPGHARGGGRCTASGQNTEFGQSPFSAAFHSQKPREASMDYAGQRNDHGFFGKQHREGKY